MLLHEKVLPKNYLCRADLSGNLMLSKWIRNHRTWKTLYFSFWDDLPVALGGTQKLLYFLSTEDCKLDSLRQSMVLRLWTLWSFFSEDLVAPVDAVYTSPWILSAHKPGVPLKPWLQSLKSLSAPQGLCRSGWVIAISEKKKCSFSKTAHLPLCSWSWHDPMWVFWIWFFTN